MPVRLKRAAKPDVFAELRVKRVRDECAAAKKRGEANVFIPALGVFLIDGDFAVSDNISGHFPRGKRISLKEKK